MTRLLAIAITAVLGFSLLAMLLAWMSPQASPPERPALMAAGVSAQSSDGSGAVAIARDKTGQFRVDGAVNGEDANFLVDTGADVVALTVEEAETLGLEVGEMQPIMQTASGTGYGAPLTIDEIEVAGTVLHNVEAVVVQDLGVNLLGQSVLRRLGGVEMKGDRMVIRSR